jgi:hypothetical protein
MSVTTSYVSRSGGTYGNVTQDGQQDVDEEVGVAAALEEDTQRRDEDGEDDLDDVAVCPSLADTPLLRSLVQRHTLR